MRLTYIPASHFIRPFFCALIALSAICGVAQHGEARTFPSVFQAWNGIANKPDEDELERLARHDLIFAGTWLFGASWMLTQDQPYAGLSTELYIDEQSARLTGLKKREALLKSNPNLRILCELRYREGRYVKDPPAEFWQRGDYPPDAPFWLRDAEGNRAPGWGEDADGDGTVELEEIRFMLVDFQQEALHDLLTEKALTLKESGLFDGIMLDWWKEHHATTGRWPDWNGTHLTREEETAARVAILRKIRAKVGDDFLILVNSNDTTIPQSAPYVNGLFMECYKPNHGEGYTTDHLARIESTLLWAEGNLQTPRINCLEGWRVVTDYAGDLASRVAERDSDENRTWMRLFTTMSLTHSDGYVLFADDNAQPSPDHLHNWYSFWDVDLGQPIGVKGRLYDGIEGLFVREFDKGWAIYNRSGSQQIVTVGQSVMSVQSGRIGSAHAVPHLDGDILLKSEG